MMGRNNQFPGPYPVLKIGFFCPVCREKFEADGIYPDIDNFSRLSNESKVRYLEKRFNHVCAEKEVK